MQAKAFLLIKSASIEKPPYICYFKTMAIHLVIDGYNLTGVMALPGQTATDLEGTREGLIKRLLVYKRAKGHRVTVVFDGKKSGSFYRTKINQYGIEIIFSKDGEEADQILKEIAKTEKQNMTLVTSDRAVASFAEAYGAIAISSDEFNAILATALYSYMKGVIDEDEDEIIVSNKSGNPRKLSKLERKRLQRMKKL
ncbi:MAG: NYN domain-containing protein [Deltaproteobacteria bacterium]|nr:NYN domain-containing protein [Deltaproteobacteria bacterium]